MFKENKLKQTYTYDDVTLIPQFSKLKSRSEADPSSHEYKLPIIASCMDTLGKDMMDVVIKQDIPFIAHRAFKSAQDQYNYFIPNDEINEYLYNDLKNVWFAVGSVQKYQKWIDYLIDKGIRQFCVDMAHGDSQICIDTILYIKERMTAVRKMLGQGISRLNQVPHIIAGNVATPEGFKRLQNAGADGIRVGIASGQCCSTAIATGFGVPILSNIIDCAKIKNSKTWLIADGGIKSIGDIAKAMYFGADFCMIGKLFAATDKACGKCYNINKEQIQDYHNLRFDHDEPSFTRPIYPEEFKEIYKLAQKYDWEKQDKQSRRKNIVNNNLVYYKSYHGMASREAREGILNYASPEGAQGLIKYSGTTEQFIKDTYLNLQAALSYGGVTNWEDFRKTVKACLRTINGTIAANTHLDVTYKE